MQGYGTPLGVYLLYALKIVGYAAGWLFFCGFTPGMGHLANLGSWCFEPEAFQKAILWSLLFEITGLGCGSGPLTGRYLPPVGGALYFLRPGTTKLPLFEGLPLIGGFQRTWVDVVLYAANAGIVIAALTSAHPDSSLLIPIAILVPVLGILDRTLFLCARGEMYRSYPEDLTPSRLAAYMGHAGTLLEFSVSDFARFKSRRPADHEFLLGMRYYAGNWDYSVWLFRGESQKKLQRLTKSAGWIYDQLGHLYDRRTCVGIVGKVMAFRLMHLHGRLLSRLVPKAVTRLDEYEWIDGELVAGMVLGWNFGDGHLHSEELLRAVQAQCSFEEGELRCIMVQSQPLGRPTLYYRIHDAKTGLIDKGYANVGELRGLQPWGVQPAHDT